jgi:hypothetical protein
MLWQIRSEFQQLGQDLQSDNLSHAQSDFATLAQNVPGINQNNTATNNNPITQAFAQLGQDLQSGNLLAAQSAFTTLQRDLQQIGGLVPSVLSGTAASTATGSLNVTA